MSALSPGVNHRNRAIDVTARNPDLDAVAALYRGKLRLPPATPESRSAAR